MKTILILFLFVCFSFGQQINHTYGSNTSGTAYTSSGASIDSLTTVSVVFDLQDYYFIDWNPLALDSVTVLYNSDALFLGTLWFYLDADSANDSTNLNIDVYPGGFTYDDADANRIETTENTFSSTAVVLRDSAANRTKGDIAWSAVNVYLNASTRLLPPEIIKIKFDIFDPSGLGGTEMAGGRIYWDFAYPSVYESEQVQRTTTRTQATNRKRAATLK